MDLMRRAGSELAYVRGLSAGLRRLTRLARDPADTFPALIERLARSHGDRPALLSDHESLSYRALDARANRYARWAIAHGVAKGDAVCLMMPNRPEYVAIWLGIARAGGVTALINTGLAGPALAHSIDIVRPRHLIVAAELAPACRSALPHMAGDVPLWLHGLGSEGRRLDDAVETFSDAPLAAAERRPVTQRDRCLYIYTSGTTGLPKAANITHYRVQAIMQGFSAVMGARASDRIYVALPLYHTSGGVIAIGACLTVGGSAFLRERFSASQFWSDVVHHRCTIFQYVGELCRYLVNAPPHPLEGSHRLRLACGNGLRPDIWVRFRERFRLPRILEFYSATESNAVLFNLDGRPGAVGRIPSWLKRRFSMRLVRYDMDADRPLRDADGRCLECAADEVGELIAEIVEHAEQPSQRFDGYADPAATARKLQRDVFRPGDLWFRTGDLMRRDAEGYFYFVDRIGDTFKWKGETVATAQVGELLTGAPGVLEASVYGVQVPGMEGRAGMAAVVAHEDFDLAAFRAHCHAALPAYARPVFVRLRPRLDITGTFKPRKTDLVGQGFDPDAIDDPVFFDHPGTGRLEPVDRSLYRRIAAHDIRL